jgi:murein tripeptide amidase MpaA
MKLPPFSALILVLTLPAAAGTAGAAGEVPMLPPEIPWDGASRALVAAADDPWITPSEATGLTATPRYAETVAWLERLVAAAPELAMVSVGKSHEGRDIWMVIASAEGATTPEAIHAAGKPLLLAHGGIHSGEIDGKDAGLMLLRDMTVAGKRKELLASASLLFIPILNVDGHERFSPFGRINQRGPEAMGWRTNTRNQNLNRDFAKLDTPGVRALVGVIEAWQPHLYLDLHVTDGADYQYDITYGYNITSWSPGISRWLEERYRPHVDGALEAGGHIPGPLVFLVDASNPQAGNFGWTASPRFSNGYGDLRHLPTVLLENHSLKPYDQRVLGTYLFLAASLEVLAEEGEALREATAADRAHRWDPVPLAWQVEGGREHPTMEFLGIRPEVELSPVSGAPVVRWTGEPVTWTVPVVTPTRPEPAVSRPVAYWIPPHWTEVIERLRLHGVRLEVQAEGRAVEVEMYRLQNATVAEEPFEGHARVEARPVGENHRWFYPPGSVRVPTDQPLGHLAIHLLEPAAPDSFFQWGFFLEVLQRTEYFESYVMEPMARRMLAEDPDLQAEFTAKVTSDPAFAGDPRARLQWFYQRTPFWDERWLLYPVGRELKGEE